jgi:acetyltransferase-like isoleucine patch superfamily enzyme
MSHEKSMRTVISALIWRMKRGKRFALGYHSFIHPLADIQVKKLVLSDYARLEGRHSRVIGPSSVLIGRHSYMSSVSIVVATDISIGSYCGFGDNLAIFTGNTHHHLERTSSFAFGNVPFYDGIQWRTVVPQAHHTLSIGSDVWIGANVFIMSSVKYVGHGVVIGAGSIVTRDIPDYAVIAGVPAKVIKYRFKPAIIKALLELKWWEWPDEKVQAYSGFLTKNLTLVDDISEEIALIK